MRITAGKARGICLKSPRGDSTRPATDAARQAVFSHLGECVTGANVLDLFAGTGSYGLEAVSRGAKSAVFVESDSGAASCIKQNIEALKKALGPNSSPTLKIARADAIKFALSIQKGAFDIVFADPPYRFYSSEDSVKNLLCAFEYIAGSQTLFVIEAPADFNLPDKDTPPYSSLKVLKRLGKASKGKPSQIVFKMLPNEAPNTKESKNS